MKIPDLYLLLRAKHLLFAQARMAWREGRPAEAVRSVESLASLSRALEGEAPLLFQLVGHQVEILQYQAIQEGLATGGLGVDYLHRLRSCAKERPRAALLRRALGTEGSMLYLMRPGSPAAPALIADRPWLDRMEYRWLGDGTVARWLDHYSELAQAFPTLTHVEMLKQGLLMPPKDGGSFGMSLGFSEGTLKATTALSDLARLSLDLAITNAETGSFPEELPSGAPKTDVSFTGSSLLYQRSADGSATLSIPGAEELWRTMRPPALDGGFREGEEPLFIWQLSPR